MKTIWKFKLELMTSQTLKMPHAHRILRVSTQFPDDDTMFLWAEVEPKTLLIPVDLRIVGTGHDVPEDHEYVGSCITQGGAFVWHVYVRRQM